VIGLQSGEEKIGERIGWSRDKIKKNVELCLHVGPEILKFAKENQKGRGPTIGPAGPKNERSVTSGLYGLLGSFPGIRKQGESRAKIYLRLNRR